MCDVKWVFRYVERHMNHTHTTPTAVPQHKTKLYPNISFLHLPRNIVTQKDELERIQKERISIVQFHWNKINVIVINKRDIETFFVLWMGINAHSFYGWSKHVNERYYRGQSERYISRKKHTSCHFEWKNGVRILKWLFRKTKWKSIENNGRWDQWFPRGRFGKFDLVYVRVVAPQADKMR